LLTLSKVKGYIIHYTCNLAYMGEQASNDHSVNLLVSDIEMPELNV